MSVIKSNTNNTLYDYFADLAEFHNMKNNLLNNSDQGFYRWFDKLHQLEPRATWIFLANHKNQLSKQQINYIEAVYGKTLEYPIKHNRGV